MVASRVHFRVGEPGIGIYNLDGSELLPQPFVVLRPATYEEWTAERALHGVGPAPPQRYYYDVSTD